MLSSAWNRNIFMTTHQPCVVDALAPEEVWMLERGSDGFSFISRGDEDPVVKAMADEGLPLALMVSDMNRR